MIKRCDSRVSATHRSPYRMRLRTARPPSLAPPHLPLKPPRLAETSRPRVVCREDAHEALSQTYTRPQQRSPNGVILTEVVLGFGGRHRGEGLWSGRGACGSCAGAVVGRIARRECGESTGAGQCARVGGRRASPRRQPRADAARRAAFAQRHPHLAHIVV
ncbi:unnamed protein product, partial [Brenthis ino]